MTVLSLSFCIIMTVLSFSLRHHYYYISVINSYKCLFMLNMYSSFSFLTYKVLFIDNLLVNFTTCVYTLQHVYAIIMGVCVCVTYKFLQTHPLIN